MLEWKLEHKLNSRLSFIIKPFSWVSVFVARTDWENVVYYGPLELTDWKSVWSSNWNFISNIHLIQLVTEPSSCQEEHSTNALLLVVQGQTRDSQWSFPSGHFGAETETRVINLSLGWCQHLDQARPHHSHLEEVGTHCRSARSITQWKSEFCQIWDQKITEQLIET